MKIKTITRDDYIRILFGDRPFYFNEANTNAGEFYDKSFKGAIFIEGFQLDWYILKSAGQLLKRRLKTPIATELVGLEFPRNHRMFRAFDTKLQQLFEGGFIGLFYSTYLRDLRTSDTKESDEPQVLTMDHLEAGFVVWLVSISFAIAAFICEWLVRFRDHLVIRFTFKAYYKHRKKRDDLQHRGTALTITR